VSSGVGTNLTVGGGASPERKWGHRSGAKNFGSKSTISRFRERFSDGQYSFVSFLFAVLLPHSATPVPSHL